MYHQQITNANKVRIVARGDLAPLSSLAVLHTRFCTTAAANNAAHMLHLQLQIYEENLV